VLIVLAGLPGSGKSTVAGDLARALKCSVLGVDEVEAALWRAGISAAQPTHHAAYLAVEAVAAEQVRLGHDVIVDAVNGPEEARAGWRSLAGRLRVELRFVEVVCSDDALYRDRLSRRTRQIDGFPEPTWEGVLQRRAEFPPWTDQRLVLDSVSDRADNLQRALRYLGPASR
jgi:predicted kinase